MPIGPNINTKNMKEKLRTWLIHRLGGITGKEAVERYCVGYRNARRYEQEFLLRVRDMIDKEIGDQADVNLFSADYLAREVRKEATK